MSNPQQELNMEHGHGHEHCHGHAPATFGVAFGIGALLNVALVVAQVVYGVLAHSTALLADAAHNFGDVLGLLVAWGAYALGRRTPTERYTYGFRSTSILAALLNAIILLIASGAIAWEAIQRLFDRNLLLAGRSSP
jgi:cobalt-zinc-cadmium efflux system protein